MTTAIYLITAAAASNDYKELFGKYGFNIFSSSMNFSLGDKQFPSRNQVVAVNGFAIFSSYYLNKLLAKIKN